jgi:UDP-N-acetylmuramate dehydrogenase
MEGMHDASDTTLAPFTSLKCGGSAETLHLPTTRSEVIELLAATEPREPVWLLGYGSNCLISDEGLPGTTIVWRGGDIQQDGTMLVADAGVWWDDLVLYAIRHGLWGLELMSEIPSSVGGAVFGNIAAYGQQVSDTLLWVEVFDRTTGSTRVMEKAAFEFAYRESSLQSQPHLIILQAAFSLADKPLHTLRYESALSIGHERGENLQTLDGLRNTIIETRRRAGSIYHPDDPNAEHTAGSFFKNPMLTTEQAISVAQYDESGKTLERILEQNKIHGGAAHRASAAHVLLAAGFTRGQTWGNVRLHPQHVLKVETLPGATATEVHQVTTEIIDTVKQKLDITIAPEVRFLGKF